MTLTRRTPLKRKRTTKRRTTSPRCSVLRCENIARIQGKCVKHAEWEADKRFSRFVRERDAGCTALGILEGPCRGPIQAAHIVGRRNHSVRWDLDNVHALCSAHHMLVDQHGREGAKYAWAVSRLGFDGYRDLMFRAMFITKRNAAIEAALDAIHPRKGEGNGSNEG